MSSRRAGLGLPGLFARASAGQGLPYKEWLVHQWAKECATGDSAGEFPLRVVWTEAGRNEASWESESGVSGRPKRIRQQNPEETTRLHPQGPALREFSTRRDARSLDWARFGMGACLKPLAQVEGRKTDRADLGTGVCTIRLRGCPHRLLDRVLPVMDQAVILLGFSPIFRRYQVIAHRPASPKAPPEIRRRRGQIEVPS